MTPELAKGVWKVGRASRGVDMTADEGNGYCLKTGAEKRERLPRGSIEKREAARKTEP